MTDPGGEMIVYAAPDDGPRVQLRAVDGTVWLSQAEIAELYGTSVPNIIQIARRVLADGEATEATLNSELRVAQEGRRQVRREVKIYNRAHPRHRLPRVDAASGPVPAVGHDGAARVPGQGLRAR